MVDQNSSRFESSHALRMIPTFIGRIEKGFDLPLLSFRPGRAIRG